MAHPGNGPDVALCRSTAVSMFKVEYFGTAAHAAMCPQEGVNMHAQISRNSTNPTCI